jgi:hypothetical protein
MRWWWANITELASCSLRRQHTYVVFLLLFDEPHDLQGDLGHRLQALHGPVDVRDAGKRCGPVGLRLAEVGRLDAARPGLHVQADAAGEKAAGLGVGDRDAFLAQNGLGGLRGPAADVEADIHLIERADQRPARDGGLQVRVPGSGVAEGLQEKRQAARCIFLRLERAGERNRFGEQKMGEPADARRLVHQRKPDTGRQVRFQNQRLPGADKIASRTDVVVSHGLVWLN